MKYTTIVALLGLLFAAGFAIAADEATRGPTTQSLAQRPPSVERDMKLMGIYYKTLKNQLADKSKNESSIDAVMQMQSATLSAKNQIPKKVSRAPQDQQAEKLTDFRAMLTNLLRHELDLEDALRANDNDKATAAFDAMTQAHDQGHKEFDVH